MQRWYNVVYGLLYCTVALKSWIRLFLIWCYQNKDLIKRCSQHKNPFWNHFAEYSARKRTELSSAWPRTKFVETHADYKQFKYVPKKEKWAKGKSFEPGEAVVTLYLTQMNILIPRQHGLCRPIPYCLESRNTHISQDMGGGGKKIVKDNRIQKYFTGSSYVV